MNDMLPSLIVAFTYSFSRLVYEAVHNINTHSCLQLATLQLMTIWSLWYKIYCLLYLYSSSILFLQLHSVLNYFKGKKNPFPLVSGCPIKCNLGPLQSNQTSLYPLLCNEVSCISESITLQSSLMGHHYSERNNVNVNEYSH